MSFAAPSRTREYQHEKNSVRIMDREAKSHRRPTAQLQAWSDERHSKTVERMDKIREDKQNALEEKCTFVPKVETTPRVGHLHSETYTHHVHKLMHRQKQRGEPPATFSTSPGAPGHSPLHNDYGGGGEGNGGGAGEDKGHFELDFLLGLVGSYHEQMNSHPPPAPPKEPSLAPGSATASVVSASASAAYAATLSATPPPAAAAAPPLDRRVEAVLGMQAAVSPSQRAARAGSPGLGGGAALDGGGGGGAPSYDMGSLQRLTATLTTERDELVAEKQQFVRRLKGENVALMAVLQEARETKGKLFDELEALEGERNALKAKKMDDLVSTIDERFANLPLATPPGGCDVARAEELHGLLHALIGRFRGHQASNLEAALELAAAAEDAFLSVQVSGGHAPRALVEGRVRELKRLADYIDLADYRAVAGCVRLLRLYPSSFPLPPSPLPLYSPTPYSGRRPASFGVVLA